MSNEMDYSKGLEVAAKPLYTGALAAGGFYFLLGETGKVIVFQQIVPGWAFVGGLVALSSYASEIAENYILPKIPDNPYSKQEAAVYGPVVAGLTTYVGAMATSTVSDLVPFVPYFGVGAAAQVVSNMTWDQYVKPMVMSAGNA